MKIGIVSLYTNEIEQIVSLTASNQKAYADKWGYGYHLFEGRLSERHPAWDKILATRKVLDLYDWVLWIDSDAVFNMFSKKIEDYIRPGYDGVFGPDPNPNIYVNTGVFLVKRSQWSHSILTKVWSEGGPKTDKIDPHSYSQWPYEQGPFNKLLKRDTHHYKVDGHEFNSHPNFVNENTYIIHYMGARTTSNQFVETINKLYKLNKKLGVKMQNLSKIKTKI